ncbi:dimethylglycine dehydrogenase, mitochondrial [Aspergillus udagawae]|uniref:Dimethylglycine dehydrogenase, mitochondrial n=1 Tax=Aspergillus udagawae TaxID=91492 RepID=A0A8H3RMY9_9EURO|nr:dimethylglycine dehydrogenase, mitochondrial [Aspergillus udagawae]GFF83733.1 dimethylglycine dehydrogenase, mitochondrial [Aspergillus udagawae]GFG08664.1 dimethylglycine dehydrogenase, mitochondrial [Aspergillus udagawae]GFG25587.1 dimethylglycine dehydrogenase, mitochondrial [Aspergillus udagawae]
MDSSEASFKLAIVGAGIVGSALAYFLSESLENGKEIVLIDRSFSQLKGSTGHAPGFIGQYNESEALTRLAMETVSEYRKIPDAFESIGGLEVATAPEGVQELRVRYDMAKKVGLPAELLSPEQAIELAPDLVKSDILTALHFASDGAANAVKITSFFQDQARQNSVHFLETDVKEIIQENGCANSVLTTSGLVKAEKVIIATGIWSENLCNFGVPIPVIPVAHPYMYGEQREPKPRKSPFVRWPEFHVYARDHGTAYGLGSYDHKPLYHKPNETAVGDWVDAFDTTLERALSLIPAETNLTIKEKFSGIFSMTPDNLPLVGTIPSIKGLYVAAAVWVTHAAGSAKFLTKLIQGEEVDESLKKALDPNRFQGKEMEVLKEESLAGYNNIYTTHEDR